VDIAMKWYCDTGHKMFFSQEGL